MSFLREVQLKDKFGPFVAFQTGLGFVPNLVQAQTSLPRLIEAQAMLESAVRLREGAIPRVQKERILLSVAAERQDAYCVSLDSRILSSLGVSDVHIDALVADYRKADLSASELACLQFCLKLSRDAPSVCSEDIDALRACGFGDESIFEAVVVTALAVYRCTLSAGVGPGAGFRTAKTPLDENRSAAWPSAPRLVVRLS